MAAHTGKNALCFGCLWQYIQYHRDKLAIPLKELFDALETESRSGKVYEWETAKFAPYQEIKAKAHEILGEDLVYLAINQVATEFFQLDHNHASLFIAQWLSFEKLKADRPEVASSAEFAFGFGGVGDFSALCAAGVFTWEEGLKLVNSRALALEEASKVGHKQGTCRVWNKTKEELTAICEKVSVEERGWTSFLTGSFQNYLAISGEYSERDFSVAGTMKTIDQLRNEFFIHSYSALYAKQALNTKLMQPAADKFSKVLEEALPRMKPPTRTVFLSSTGEALAPGTEPSEIVKLLIKEITTPILFDKAFTNLNGRGSIWMYDLSPGAEFSRRATYCDESAHTRITDIIQLIRPLREENFKVPGYKD